MDKAKTLLYKWRAKNAFAHYHLDICLRLGT
jgi:hypothetical protein